MNPPRKALAWAALFVLFASLLALPAQADPGGSWICSEAAQSERTGALVLTVDSEGPTLSGFYFEGKSKYPIPIVSARMNSTTGTVSFAVVRKFNGERHVITFTGVQDGDTITGKAQVEYAGQVHSSTWVATRRFNANGVACRVK